jgi:hypothetical protein
MSRDLTLEDILRDDDPLGEDFDELDYIRPYGGGAKKPGQRFGARRTRKDGSAYGHTGEDSGGPEGDDVLAPADLEITHVGPRGGYGNLVIGKDPAGLEHYLAHLSEAAAQVGQRVKQGERVGRVGRTGKATGPHVHWETRENGKPVDPETIVGKRKFRRVRGQQDRDLTLEDILNDGEQGAKTEPQDQPLTLESILEEPKTEPTETATKEIVTEQQGYTVETLGDGATAELATNDPELGAYLQSTQAEAAKGDRDLANDEYRLAEAAQKQKESRLLVPVPKGGGLTQDAVNRALAESYYGPERTPGEHVSKEQAFSKRGVGKPMLLSGDRSNYASEEEGAAYLADPANYYTDPRTGQLSLIVNVNPEERARAKELQQDWASIQFEEDADELAAKGMAELAEVYRTLGRRVQGRNRRKLYLDDLSAQIREQGRQKGWDEARIKEEIRRRTNTDLEDMVSGASTMLGDTFKGELLGSALDPEALAGQDGAFGQLAPYFGNMGASAFGSMFRGDGTDPRRFAEYHSMSPEERRQFEMATSDESAGLVAQLGGSSLMGSVIGMLGGYRAGGALAESTLGLLRAGRMGVRGSKLAGALEELPLARDIVTGGITGAYRGGLQYQNDAEKSHAANLAARVENAIYTAFTDAFQIAGEGLLKRGALGAGTFNRADDAGVLTPFGKTSTMSPQGGATGFIRDRVLESLGELASGRPLSYLEGDDPFDPKGLLLDALIPFSIASMDVQAPGAAETFRGRAAADLGAVANMHREAIEEDPEGYVRTQQHYGNVALELARIKQIAPEIGEDKAVALTLQAVQRIPNPSHAVDLLTAFSRQTPEQLTALAEGFFANQRNAETLLTDPEFLESRAAQWEGDAAAQLAEIEGEAQTAQTELEGAQAQLQQATEARANLDNLVAQRANEGNLALPLNYDQANAIVNTNLQRSQAKVEELTARQQELASVQKEATVQRDDALARAEEYRTRAAERRVEREQQATVATEERQKREQASAKIRQQNAAAPREAAPPQEPAAAQERPEGDGEGGVQQTATRLYEGARKALESTGREITDELEQNLKDSTKIVANLASHIRTKLKLEGATDEQVERMFFGERGIAGFFEGGGEIEVTNPEKGTKYKPRGEYVREGFVKLYKSADPSTIIHESAHHFRRFLSKDDVQLLDAFVTEYGKANPKMVSRVTGGRAKTADGDWAADLGKDELFTALVEGYLRTGKAPEGASKEVKALFKRVRSFMAGIYRFISRSPVIDVADMSPEVKAWAEAALLGKTEQATEQAPNKLTNALAAYGQTAALQGVDPGVLALRRVEFLTEFRAANPDATDAAAITYLAEHMPAEFWEAEAGLLLREGGFRKGRKGHDELVKLGREAAKANAQLREVEALAKAAGITLQQPAAEEEQADEPRYQQEPAEAAFDFLAGYSADVREALAAGFGKDRLKKRFGLGQNEAVKLTVAQRLVAEGPTETDLLIIDLARQGLAQRKISDELKAKGMKSSRRMIVQPILEITRAGRTLKEATEQRENVPFSQQRVAYTRKSGERVDTASTYEAMWAWKLDNGRVPNLAGWIHDEFAVPVPESLRARTKTKKTLLDFIEVHVEDSKPVVILREVKGEPYVTDARTVARREAVEAWAETSEGRTQIKALAERAAPGVVGDDFEVRYNQIGVSESFGNLTAAERDEAREGMSFKPRAKRQETEAEAQKRGRRLVNEYARRARAQGMERYQQPAVATDPNFLRWFGKSTARDEFGNPKIYYSGTTRGDIDAFKPSSGARADIEAIYFSPEPGVASGYAETRQRHQSRYGQGGEGQYATVYPVYVRAEKPFDYEDPADIAAFIDWLQTKKKQSKEEAEFTAHPVARGEWRAVQGPWMEMFLAESDYDSFYVRERPDHPVKNLAVLSGAQVKSIFNKGLFSTTDDRMLYQQPVEENPNFRRWFGASKVVDEQGKPKMVFRGDYRADRLGNSFKLGRSTSAHGFFFTDSPEVASSYAISKPDSAAVEEASDYSDRFRLKVKGQRTPARLDQLRFHTTAEEQAAFLDALLRFGTDEETGDYIWAEPGEGSIGRRTLEDYLRRNRGDVFTTAADVLLASAVIGPGEEQEFMRLFTRAGIEGVEYVDPFAQRSAVTPVYLSIKRPLDTSNTPSDVVEALRQMARRDRTRPRGWGVDMWDYRNTTAREWFETLEQDLEEGTTLAWTTIPKKVVQTLEALGYDGVHDTGGKLGGDTHAVWIAFKPTQIKSAFNRGTFDPDKSDIRYQQPVFYSAAEVAVDKLFRSAQSIKADSLVNALQREGAKPQEIEELGLADLAREHRGKKLTAAQVRERVDLNRLEIVEVKKGFPLENAPPLEWSESTAHAGEWTALDRLTGYRYYIQPSSAGDFHVRASGGRNFGYEQSLEEAKARVEEIRGKDTTDDTRWEDWLEPFSVGKNYREILFTWPNKARTMDQIAMDLYMQGWSSDLTPDQQEEVRRVFEAQRRKPSDTWRYTTHWSEDDVLMHVRFDERLDSRGRRTLFLQEIQSDWHQTGKKDGYKGNVSIEGWKPADPGKSARQESEGTRAFTVINPEGRRFTEYAHTWEDAAEIAATRDTVPDAPLKESPSGDRKWAEYVIKRMLRYAADNGFEVVAWTTGDQQSERYSLDTYIDKLSWRQQENGTFELRGYKDGSRSFLQGNVKPEELPEWVGEGVARQITEATERFDGSEPIKPLEWGEPNDLSRSYVIVLTGAPIKEWTDSTGHYRILEYKEDPDGMGSPFRLKDTDDRGGWYSTLTDAKKEADFDNREVNAGTISGEQMRVGHGGSGMRSFYDEKIPGFVNRYTKKWGGKVRPGVVLDVDHYSAQDLKDGRGIDQQTTDDLLVKKNEAHRVHTLELTPEMRTAMQEPQPLYQQPVSEMFYSQTQRAVDAAYAKAGSIKADSLLNVLQKHGAKPQELEELGLADFLKSRKSEKLTRADVQQIIDLNKIEVEEVGYGFTGRTTDEIDAELDAIMAEHDELNGVREGDEAIPLDGEHETRYNELMEERQRARFGSKSPKWEAYTLSGDKKNYRELLFTLPVTPATRLKNRAAKEAIDRHGFLGTLDPQGEEMRRLGALRAADARFRNSTHWDEDNVLAWARFDDRTDADGKRTLFVEEIQSDWHQQGKKKGYNDGKWRERWEQLNARYDELGAQIAARLQERLKGYEAESLMDLLKRDRDLAAMYRRENERDAALQALISEQEEVKRQRDEANRSGQGVPDAPLKESASGDIKWQEFVFKRMLKYAVDNGYDSISWTTGDQQAERYSLDRYVDSIEWQRSPQGDYLLRGYKDGRETFLQSAIQPEQLAEYVGDGVAQQILDAAAAERQPVAWAQTNDRRWDAVRVPLWVEREGRTEDFNLYRGHRDTGRILIGYYPTLEEAQRAASENDAAVPTGRLTQENLRIGNGGEGMRTVYDRKLPSFVNKYTKRWGGRVTTAKVDDDKFARHSYTGPDLDLEEFLERSRSYIKKLRDKQEFNATTWGDENLLSQFEEVKQRLQSGDTYAEAVEAKGSQALVMLIGVGKLDPVMGQHEVHTLRVTPEMKRSLETEPQPLYQQPVMDPEVYGTDYALPVEGQEYTSERTSVNVSKPPAAFAKIPWVSGQRNVDIGGGRYDAGSDYLKADHGVTSKVIDPFNRPEAHNRKVAAEFAKRPADTATLTNVLNVIREPEQRQAALKAARRYVRDGGKLYVQVYPGDGSGEGRETSAGWQENRPLRSYLAEVEEAYPHGNARVRGNYIEITVDRPDARYQPEADEEPPESPELKEARAKADALANEMAGIRENMASHREDLEKLTKLLHELPAVYGEGRPKFDTREEFVAYREKWEAEHEALRTAKVWNGQELYRLNKRLEELDAQFNEAWREQGRLLDLHNQYAATWRKQKGFVPREVVPGLYSAAEQAVKKIFAKANAIKAESFVKELQKQGAKPAEIRDLGLDRLAEAYKNGRVTKEAAEDWIRANQLTIEETEMPEDGGQDLSGAYWSGYGDEYEFRVPGTRGYGAEETYATAERVIINDGVSRSSGVDEDGEEYEDEEYDEDERQEIWSVYDLDGVHLWDIEDGTPGDTDVERTIEALKEKGVKFTPGAEYKQYTTGGTDVWEGSYRELVFNMPDRAADVNRAYTAASDALLRFRSRLIGEQGVPWGAVERTPAQDAEFDSLLDAQSRARVAAEASGNYEAPHFSDQDRDTNLLAHARVQDRGNNVNRYLEVVEIQSDWHQDGKKYGYKTGMESEEGDPQVNAWDDRVEEINDQITRTIRMRADLTTQRDNEKRRFKPLLDQLEEEGYWEMSAQERRKRPDLIEIDRQISASQDFDAEIDELTNRESALGKERNQLLAKIDRAEARDRQKPPQGPLADNWFEFVMKRLIAYAVENGYAGIIIDGADTHTERWGTERAAWEYVPKMEPWTVTEEGGKFYLAPPDWDKSKGAAGEGPFDTREQAEYRAGEIGRYRKDRGDFFNFSWKGQVGGFAGGVDLEMEGTNRNYIINTRGEQVRSQDDVADVLAKDRSVAKSDIDLMAAKIWRKMQKEPSGEMYPRKEGFESFYDNRLPNWLKGYVKRWGATVEETRINTGDDGSSTDGEGVELRPVDVRDRGRELQTVDANGEGAELDHQIGQILIDVADKMERHGLGFDHAIARLRHDESRSSDERGFYENEISDEVWNGAREELETMWQERQEEAVAATSKAWKLDFTPKMRESVRTDLQPLYQQPVNQPGIRAGIQQQLQAAQQQAQAANQALATAYQQQRQRTIVDAIDAYLKANLLTGPATHATNVSSNAIEALIRGAAQVPAGFWDIIGMRLLNTGMRSTTMSVIPHFRGVMQLFVNAQGALEQNAQGQMQVRQFNRAAWRRGFEALAEGVSEKWESGNPGRLQLPGAIEWSRPAWNLVETYSSIVFGFLGLEDAVFSTIAIRASLDDQARAMAKNTGGSNWYPEYQRIIHDPTIEMVNAALAEAAQATFQQSTAFHEALTAAKNRLAEVPYGGDIARLIANQFVPFSRTPSALIANATELAGGGFVKAGVRAAEIRRAVRDGALQTAVGQREVFELQRRMARSAGYASVGAAFWIGFLAGLRELIKERINPEKDKLAARQSDVEGMGYTGGRIRFGAHSYDLDSTGPVGFMMLQGKEVGNALAAEGEVTPRVVNAMVAAMNNVMELPAIKSFFDLAALKDSEYKQNRFAAGYAQRPIPAMSFLNALAKHNDPYERKATTVGEMVQAGIPGKRQELPTKPDPMTGEPQARKRENVFAPFAPQRYQGGDPLVKALLDSRVSPPNLRQRKDESEEEFTERRKRYLASWRDAIREGIEDDEFKALPPAKKGDPPEPPPDEEGDPQEPQNRGQWLRRYLREADITGDE